MTTTNDPRAQHNHFYDTPEGHDQPLEFMRNSAGNGAVGAAAGGELLPGRATGGASLTASGGEPPQGDGRPPNDGAQQEQVPLTHASSHAADDFDITDEDLMNLFTEFQGAESSKNVSANSSALSTAPSRSGRSARPKARATPASWLLRPWPMAFTSSLRWEATVRRTRS